jgi:hypothetical protein
MTAFARLLSERSWLSPTTAESLQTADLKLALALA